MDLSARATRSKVVERRAVPFRDVELRAGAGAGDSLTFTGYACVTEQGYEMQDWLGPYDEVVRSGAFTKTLSEGADVPFLVNHGGLTLARTKSATMRLAEDDTGLHVEADLDPASPHVQALRSAMDRGDVDEMSFAFWVTRQQWSPDFTQRDILEVNLNKGDVSVVNYGANPHTAGAQLSSRQLVTALRQVRAGTALTPEAWETLGQVLQLISAADGAVDVAQPLLADVLGVPNPDAEDDAEEPAEPAAQEQDAADAELYEFRRRLLAL
ncbi:MAG: HK97 family phage prohead protease [Actinoallomurus sp.]